MIQLLKKNKYNIFLLFFSFVEKFISSLASPIYDYCTFTGDNIIFYIMGKMILRGDVLYKEIFDHKPPLILFLNAMANLLPIRHIGLYIMESIFCFVILYNLYKILLLFISDKNRVIIIVILTSILINTKYAFGMFKTEGYAMAFWLFGIRYFIEYILEIRNFDKKQIFLSGIIAGLTFLVNMKVAILYIPFALVMAYKLILNKQFRNIVFAFIYGILGIMVSILPFTIYALITDSLQDMIYANFTFNFLYMDKISSNINDTSSLFSVVYAYIVTWKIFFIILFASSISLFFIKCNKYIKFIFYLSFLLSFYIIINAYRVYGYYLFIFFIYFIPIIIIISRYFNGFYNKRTIFILSFIVIFILIVYSYSSYNVRNEGLHTYKNEFSEILKKEFPDVEDFNDLKILSFGFNPEVYCLLDVTPKFKHFHIPSISYDICKLPFLEQLKYINNKEPDVVIYRYSSTLPYPLLPKHYIDRLAGILTLNYNEVGKVKDLQNTDNDGHDYFIFVKKYD